MESDKIRSKTINEFVLKKVHVLKAWKQLKPMDGY